MHIFETGANWGFARAANVGLKAARGTHLLFLNPDTLAPQGALNTALRIAQRHPEIGVLGARLLNGDGSPQPSCGCFLSLSALVRANVLRLVGRRLEEKGAGGGRLWVGSDFEEVDWLIGAFLLCRRTVMAEVGGFDEDYFLYVEDMDLCYRVRQRGYRVVYCPAVTVCHYGNRSAARKWGEQREAEIVRAELIFLRKHQGMRAALAFRLLAGGLFFSKGIWRLLGGWSRETRDRQQARRYWRMTKVCLGWE